MIHYYDGHLGSVMTSDVASITVSTARESSTVALVFGYWTLVQATWINSDGA